MQLPVTNMLRQNNLKTEIQLLQLLTEIMIYFILFYTTEQL